jgi:hypothetical protein
MTTDQPGDDATSADRSATSTGNQTEPTKPITISLSEDILKKLRIIAIVKGSSVTALVAEAASSVVRKELKKALAKLAE